MSFMKSTGVAEPFLQAIKVAGIDTEEDGPDPDRGAGRVQWPPACCPSQRQ